MNLQRILFPTDFSLQSQPALELATALAREAGAKLLIVHVQEPPIELVAEGAYGFSELHPDKQAIEAQLKQIVPADAAVPYEHHVLFGSPAAEIVQLAKHENVDLIVMSTHGRTGLMHLLMGSVAEAVLRRAPCPVITLRAGAEGAATAGEAS
jgi:universal stress protein A